MAETDGADVDFLGGSLAKSHHKSTFGLENQASPKWRVTDGSTGMPGPVVVDTVIFLR